MICPNCGNTIEEGSLFCENCSHEIKIVPEYDSQIEQKINETMSTITDELSREARKQRELERREQILEEKQRKEEEAARERIRKRRRLIAVCAIVLICAAGLLGLYQYNRLHSASYYVGKAYDRAAAGDYEQAVELIDQALELDGADEVRLSLLKTDYLVEARQFDQADLLLSGLLEQDSLTQDERRQIYEHLFQVLASAGRYDDIAERIAACDDPVILREYADYAAPAPVIDMDSGEYEDQLTVSIQAPAGASVFYTLDGTEPSTHSLLYQKPIELKPGSYELCAVTVNRYGAASPSEKRSYDISTTVPEAPKVLTAEGDYERATLITVVVPEGETVYYTTDGTDPTEESTRYDRPIQMPIGTTTFRFIAYGHLGISGEITEVTYRLTPKANLSVEDGINHILIAMINRQEIIDVNGTVPGGTAMVSYHYTRTEQLSGYGSYYIYEEYITDLYGNVTPTTRRFAVNIANGTVNYMDVSGILVPIG